MSAPWEFQPFVGVEPTLVKGMGPVYYVTGVHPDIAPSHWQGYYYKVSKFTEDQAAQRWAEKHGVVITKTSPGIYEIVKGA